MISIKLIFDFYLTLLIPLLYFLGIIISLKSPSTLPFYRSTVLPFFSLLICLFGLLLWSWSYLSLRRQLTVLPKAKKLITSGPYRFFRHPIYLGIILTLLGLALALASFPGLIYTIVIIIPLNLYRAQKEEKILLKKFPKKYAKYQKKTLL